MNSLDHLESSIGSSHTEDRQALKALAQLSLTPLGTWVRVLMRVPRTSATGGGPHTGGGAEGEASEEAPSAELDGVADGEVATTADGAGPRGWAF